MTPIAKTTILAAALLAQSALFTALPSTAQAMNLPSLSFPSAETDWGCKFTGTCDTPAPVTKAAR